MNKLYNLGIIVSVTVKLIALAPVGVAVVGIELGAELARKAAPHLERAAAALARRIDL